MERALTTSCADTIPVKTVLLTRQDVAALLSIDECIAAVEDAFRLHAQGRTLPPGVLGMPSKDGGFHIKAAGLRQERTWFAVKCNGNFPGNPRRGLPTIQGIVVLCDAGDGQVLAVMDSMEITSLRTAAATALAARYLAREDARVATICGCGLQGRAQLLALARVRPLARVFAFDAEPSRAERFASEMKGMGLEVEAVSDLHAATRASDIIVTCTTAKSFILGYEDVRPGTFVAGVGADNADKQELDPRLLASATVVVDNLEQCAAIGDLHHAIAGGHMTTADVHAELADLVGGSKQGRTRPDEIAVFDSTGVALEDVGAAAAVYRRAVATGSGLRLDFGV